METEPIEITGMVSNETAAAVFSLLREDIANMRKDNADQHKDIVHRLDTINGRVQKHDREIGDIQGKTNQIEEIGKNVRHIDQNYLSKTAGWTGFTFVVGGFGAVLLWMLDRVLK